MCLSETFYSCAPLAVKCDVKEIDSHVKWHTFDDMSLILYEMSFASRKARPRGTKLLEGHVKNLHRVHLSSFEMMKIIELLLAVCPS